MALWTPEPSQQVPAKTKQIRTKPNYYISSAYICYSPVYLYK